MKQEKKHRPWMGAAAGAAVLALVLTATLTLSGGGSGWTGAVLPGSEPAVTAMGTGAGSRVVPMGRAVGIKLFSDGVLVVGLSGVDTAQGKQEPGKTAGLKAGDIITSIDGAKTDTIEQVQQILAEKGSGVLTLQVLRGEKALQLGVTPATNQEGAAQLGVWLRDSMAGIGTMTFYDPQTGAFGALGHGVNDVDTAKLMPLQSGSIMYASVTDVKRGESGDPGELHGAFDVGRDLGELYANTGMGLYGTLTDRSLAGQDTVEVAGRSQVHEGAATILSNIRGETVEQFAIEIVQVYPHTPGETRNMMIQVTDPKLLESTGGIVQGMSGSPILQDGRLVGAVTHVLVSDPTRGYAILAQEMLDQSQQQLQAKAS